MNQPVSEAHGSQEAQGSEEAQAQGSPEDTARLLARALGGDVEVGLDAHGIPSARVPRELWTTAARFVRDDLGLDFFDWLSAVDQFDADPAGLDVVVHVADSYGAHRGAADPSSDVVVRRMLLMTRVPQDDLTLESLTSVWSGAAWHERETYEMFGLSFTDFHEATGLGLRPLLLPDGFEGNPLLKSFQLASRAVRPWPGAGEPGESGQGAASRRNKVQAPGVPDPDTWGPREAGPVAADVPGENSGD